jgi:hypothetical protein
MGIERQFTVFLENKPGRLLNICNALAKEKVSIQALTVMDGKTQSILRFVVDNDEGARTALKRLGTPYSETEIMAVELKHQTGELAHLCERLAAEHINIDYMYCSAGRKNGKVNAILKASPLDKVKSVLASNAPVRPIRGPIRRPPARRV